MKINKKAHIVILHILVLFILGCVLYYFYNNTNSKDIKDIDKIFYEKTMIDVLGLNIIASEINNAESITDLDDLKNLVLKSKQKINNLETTKKLIKPKKYIDKILNINLEMIVQRKIYIKKIKFNKEEMTSLFNEFIKYRDLYFKFFEDNDYTFPMKQLRKDLQ